MRAGQWVGELLGLAQEPRLCPERQHLSLTLALPPPPPPLGCRCFRSRS